MIVTKLFFIFIFKAKQISEEIDEMMNSINEIGERYLTVGQAMTHRSNAALFALEKFTRTSLLNQSRNGIRFLPTDMNAQTFVDSTAVRVRVSDRTINSIR